MSVTRARLAALRREVGARSSAVAFLRGAGGRSPVPADVSQLRQLLRVRTPRAQQRHAAPQDRVLPGKVIAPGLREVTARLPAEPLPPQLRGEFDRRPDFDPRGVVFFDTETTGLAGGAGTRAFMIGMARWREGMLEIRQLLITRLAAEAAMLAEFAGWIEPSAVLASYNGKSYDAPLLRARYRLARMHDPLAGSAHVDLLYPVRRRYRGRFENCRLVTIERNVLKIIREDDLPGSEAPAAWLTYLHGGPSGNLCRVVAHNRQDVATLARLMLHLSA